MNVRSHRWFCSRDNRWRDPGKRETTCIKILLCLALRPKRKHSQLPERLSGSAQISADLSTLSGEVSGPGNLKIEIFCEPLTLSLSIEKTTQRVKETQVFINNFELLLFPSSSCLSRSWSDFSAGAAHICVEAEWKSWTSKSLRGKLCTFHAQFCSLADPWGQTNLQHATSATNSGLEPASKMTGAMQARCWKHEPKTRGICPGSHRGSPGNALTALPTALLAWYHSFSPGHLHVQSPKLPRGTCHSDSRHMRSGHFCVDTPRGKPPRWQTLPLQASSCSSSHVVRTRLETRKASEGVWTTRRGCSTHRRPRRCRKSTSSPGEPYPSFGLHSTSTASWASQSLVRRGTQLSQSYIPPGVVGLWMSLDHGPYLYVVNYFRAKVA